MNEWRNPRLAANQYASPGELINIAHIPPAFKPRLRLHLKLWHCASRVPRVIGYGYTALDAYKEWQREASNDSREERE